MPITTSSTELRATTTSSILMDELYNSSTHRFKSEGVEDLFRTITNHSLIDNNFKEYLENQGGSMNAADFRENAGQDVRVTLFGFTWYPMYISMDVYDEVVLTLWLDNYAQDSLEDSTVYADKRILADYFGFCCYDGFLYWVPDGGIIHPDTEFDREALSATLTNNMYTWARGSRQQPVHRAIVSAFGSSDLSGLIYPPCYMPYQEYQSAKEILGLPYNLQNEAWSEDLSDDDFYSPEYNTYSYFRYSYTFLPSLSEIGYSGVSGLWGASPAQRACNATASEDLYATISGSGSKHEIANNTLTRSGNYKQTYGYYFVKSSGEGKGVGASCARVSRPCINLFLDICMNTLFYE